jgi:anti-anti-sigma regulatory factor
MAQEALFLSEPVEENVLRLEGSVDVSRAQRLLETAREREKASGDVMVECAAVERLDASAVQILLALKRSLEASGRTLRMQNVPDRIFELLLRTGVGQALVARTTRELSDECQQDAGGASRPPNASVEEQRPSSPDDAGDGEEESGGEPIDVEALFARQE